MLKRALFFSNPYHPKLPLHKMRNTFCVTHNVVYLWHGKKR